MTARVISDPASAYFAVVTTNSDEVRRCLLAIIRQGDPSFDPAHCGSSFGRRPICVPFTVTPVACDGTEVWFHKGPCEILSVASQDLSFDGIKFAHQTPIGEQHFIATFPALESMSASLLVERRWTKEFRLNKYLSGGRFLGVVEFWQRDEKSSAPGPLGRG